MTRQEFENDVGAYASKLWPKLLLTNEQSEMWFHKLSSHTTFDVRKVLGEAYASCKWKEPALADVVALLKAETRMEVKTSKDFSPELIAQVNEEEQEEAALLAEWTPEDYENGKREIIAHEPGMAVFEGVPANGPMWRHFLVERYLFERVATFPGKTQIIRRPNEQDVIIPPPVVYVSRAMAWANGPQPRRVGIQSVSGGARERHAAQEAKVELNEAVTA